MLHTLIPVVLVAPWVVAAAWCFNRTQRTTETHLSYIEAAKRRLSVR